MKETLEALAGTLPDGQVAERLGLDVETVKAWRRRHGVAPYRKPPPGPRRAAAPPPPPAATAAAPSRRRVRRRRNDEVVDVVVPASSQSPRATAAAQLDAFRDRLGKVPDDVIAREAGLSRRSVGAYRRKHGIPAYSGYQFSPGHAPQTRRATSAKPSAKAPQRARGARGSRIDAFAHLVGVETDASVAAKAGVTTSAVTGWRRRRGIPAASAAPAEGKASPREAPATLQGSAARLAPFVDRMGRIPDHEVAALAGVSRDVVGAYRRKHGIPAWQGPRAPRRAAAVPAAAAPAAPSPAPAAATVRSLVAYRVLATAGGVQRAFIAAGEDLVAACARAEEGLLARPDGPWRVDAVELLGDAFA